MAIEKFKLKSGEVRFRAIWINPITKKKESKSFLNLFDAQEYDLKMKRLIAESPESFGQRVEDNSFSELAWAYFQMSQMSDSNKYGNITMLKASILPVIGDIDCKELTKKHMSAIIKHCLKRGNKLITIKRNIGIVKAILNWGVLQGYLESNPIHGYIIKKATPEKFRPLTTEERDLIWSVAQPHVKRAIIISTGIGVRVGKSELFKLKWSDVNFVNGTITVTSARKNMEKQYRIIELNPSMISILEEWHQADSKEGIEHIIHFRKKQIKSMIKSWNKTKERVGIERRIRPYDMRHYFVTEAIRAGADLKAVAEIVGHADLTMILRHYQYTMVEQKRFAVSAIPMPKAIPNGNNNGNIGG